MKFVFLIFFFLASTAAGFCHSSQQNQDSFISRSDSIITEFPVEKVHLHLDKPFYAAGQTIWFKAYVVDGANQPSMLSKILYVDLINEAKQIKRRIKLPISAGLGWGDIALADTLSEGNYRIRAYTQWMRNFGEESFYDHSFIIVNSFKSSGVKSRPKVDSNQISVQFFPEGGKQIEGVRSRIAFKTLGSNGLGRDVSGFVLDNLGIRVAEFKTDHAGMGSFMLTPFEGKNYKATITFPDGDKIFPLPEAAKEGYALNINSDLPEKVIVRVTASPGTPIDDKELTIAIKSLDGSVMQSAFKMSKQFADVTISTAEMKTGIAQITLFDKKESPIAERLIFVKKDDGLTISLSSNKSEYKKREKVKLEIAPAVADQSYAIASFSIAVTNVDRTSFKEDEESTIFSELLVKSELKGFIENANYYFTGDAEALKLKWKHLDNLLMTQGWRRLDLVQTKPKLVFNAESGISISGKILRTGSPVVGGRITAFSPDAGIFIDTVSNSQGRFIFDNLIFPDSTKFVIQGRTERSKANVQIQLDQVPRQQISTDFHPSEVKDDIPLLMQPHIKDIKDELAELLKQGIISRTNILDEVVVKAVRDPKKLENSSKLGSAPADFVLRSDQLSGDNLGLALKGKVLGFDYYYADPYKRTMVGSLTRNTLLSGQTSMQVFVDGMNMGTDLLQINMSDIAYVEVLTGGISAAMYGGRGAAGVIIVTTKGYAGTNTGAEVMANAKGIVKYLPQGYTVSRTFYSPDYDSSTTINEAADFRSTIYWNPDIFSDKGVVKPIEFFTADKPGSYRIVVEGLDYKGRLGRVVKTITVQ